MGAFRKKLRPSRGASERGAVLVEFVLILPILLVFVLGIIEMSWLTFGFTEVWSGAREGARYATTSGDNDGDGIPNYAECADIVAAAGSRLSANTLTGVSVTYETPEGNTYDCQGGTPPLEGDVDAGVGVTPGTVITVEVEASYNALGIPFLTTAFDGLDLGASVVRTMQGGWEFG